MKLSELKIGKLIQDGEFNWLGLTAEEYKGKKVLTFLNNEKYIEEIKKNGTITCILTTKQIFENLEKDRYGIIVTENPKKDFFELHNYLVEQKFYYRDFETEIALSAKIAKDVIIPKKNVIIEENVIIESGTVIKENVILRKNSIIRSNCVIGDQAFEFYKDNKIIMPIKCGGNIEIEEYCEIQSGTVIEKGVFSTTRIGKNVKIDNLIHIGHDVKIGENTFVIAGSVIGGRTKIGKNCYLSINSSIRNGLIIGDNVTINMAAVVTKNINNNEVITGNFAISHSKFLKIFKYLLEKIGD